MTDDQARPPLYQNPKKDSFDDGTKTPTSQSQSNKKRKSSAGRIPSAKNTTKVSSYL